MATILETTALRDDLLSRRARLGRIASASEQARDLLRQVDDVLGRMDAGTFGVCDVCHETVEAEALRADPLCRVCLDHLTADERRRLEHDLELAGRVQTGLLPQRDLRLPGWEIHTHYAPAGVVSGDYYEVLPREGHDPVVLLGDIAGKGVAASLLMASLQAIVRSLAAEPGAVCDLLGGANRLFCQSTALHSFATLVCAEVAPGGSVTLANAGHWPPLVRSSAGVAALPADGLPIGLFCDAAYAPRRLALAPGDALVLYTDGLPEARSAADEEYGGARLAAALEATQGLPAGQTAARLLSDLAAFQGPARRGDDLTLMVLGRVPDRS